MINKMLLPHGFKRTGWIILIASIILGVYQQINGDGAIKWEASTFAILSDEILGEAHNFSVIQTDIATTVIGSLIIIGSLMVGFSKEKNEDEFISALRLSSLQWAVLVNYLLLLFMFLFVYGISFFSVMMYNMFTVLFIYIIRFNYILYRKNR